MKAKELLGKIETHNEIERLIGGKEVTLHLDVNGHTLFDDEGGFKFKNYKSFKKAVNCRYTTEMAEVILDMDIDVNEKMTMWVLDDFGNRKRIPLWFYVK